MLRPTASQCQKCRSVRTWGSTIHVWCSSSFRRGISSESAPTPIQPQPSSLHHDSLESFLKYAREASLSPKSTTYVGTRYEYLCLSALVRLGFTLTRTGGRSDHGIDLLGHWQLPSLPFPLPVVMQCKALKSKAGPNLVRELEGAFVGAPRGWKGENVVGVLCAPREATKGVMEAIRILGRPAMWIMIEDHQDHGRVRQMVWNERVGEIGAEGVGVQIRYLPSQGQENVEKEVVLTWKGSIWEPRHVRDHRAEAADHSNG